MIIANEANGKPRATGCFSSTVAQVSWIYVDDFGGKHRVGLYHGDHSGHLLIHCDARIVQVDFSVKESRVYSFFIEDELCEIGVHKEAEGFSYDFRINRQVDTPRNRQRRAVERRNWWGVGAVLLALIAVISAAVFFLLRWDRQQKQERWAQAFVFYLSPRQERRLLTEGHTSIAQLFVAYENQRRVVYYSFLTQDNRPITGRFEVPDTGLILLPNGFPVHDRNAFTVRYVPGEPGIHRLLFEEPTTETIAHYLDQATRAQQAANPNDSPGRSRCVAQLTLQEKGWTYLADLIFQTASARQNPQHNRDSYLRLIRDPALAQKIQQQCWDR